MHEAAAPSAVPDGAAPVPTDAERPILAYRPEIDGLRAVAVVPVILFHLGVPGIVGGGLGVDVFFVISGFLITSIIRRETEAGTFSLRRFWARRVRRILPAMLAVTVTVLAVSGLTLFRYDRSLVGRQAAWGLLSGANFYFYFFVGKYMGMTAAQSPLLHLWSLAVEEQFYLLLAPAVWWLDRVAPRRLLAGVLAALFASFTLCLVVLRHDADAAFYLLPTRAWELAAGCALAAAGRDDGRRAWLGTVGLAAIVASYFTLSGFGVGAVLPVGGTVLVLAFARSGPSHWLLASRPCVAVGRLSYSLYLWHWPVIVLPALAGRPLGIYAAIGIATALSVASYFAIERPTRHARGAVPWITAALGLTVTAAVLMGTVLRFYDTRDFNTPVSDERAYDCNPHPPPLNDAYADYDVRPPPATPRAFVEGGVVSGGGTPEVVMLGDSHACFWAPVVRRCTDRLGVTASFWMMTGVTPFFQVPARPRPDLAWLSSADLLAYDDARQRLIAEWKPRLAVVAARWSNINPDDVRPTLDFLARHAGRVLLIEQPPQLPTGDRNVMQWLCSQKYRPRPGVRQYCEQTNYSKTRRGRQAIARMAAAYPNVSVVPTHDLFEHGTQALVLDGRDVLYLDDDHLTDQGASLGQERIDRAVTAALEAEPPRPRATPIDSPVGQR